MNHPKRVQSIDIEVRVRYAECDAQNMAHHSVYPVWMEMARTELLRARGMAYRDMEANGVYFVVARMSLRYRLPARYDDVLRVQVKVRHSGAIKIDHDYEIYRDDELLASGQTTLVCIDTDRKVQRIPKELR